VELARAAVAEAPGNPAVHRLLARSLGGAGKLDEAVGCLNDACARFPADEALHEELANALARVGGVEAALALARDRRDSPWAALFAFRLLRRQGRGAEAEALEPAVAAAAPADPDLLEARAARAHADPRALLALCEAVLVHDPGAAHALHYKAVALAQLGRGDEAAALMALDRYLHRQVLPPPPGFAGASDFGATLRREILANPTLHPDPAGHASSGGLRTRLFPHPGDVAAPRLTEAIRDAISVYAEALTGGHPFVRARPQRATFTPWALVFRGSGRQILHHHPGRWLTGVYYVGGEGEIGAGALRVGGLPRWAGVEPPWPMLDVEPSPGTLLLFPSFVPHETVPPGSAAERISVAFDVAAAG